MQPFNQKYLDQECLSERRMMITQMMLSCFLLCFACFSIHQFCWAEEARVRSSDAYINVSTPVTSETDPVLHMDVSDDGRFIVYSSGREGFTDLWLQSADTSRLMLPRRLTSDPSDESHPAFSPDGRFIAYVGTGYDVKGDIYLLDMQQENARPVRLTGRKTEDGGPCFGPQGYELYFHQVKSGDRLRKIVRVNLDSFVEKDESTFQNVSLIPLNTHGDGVFPAVSPDNSLVAFVSFRDDPGGDVFILDRAKNRVTKLTQSRYPDMMPCWAPDGKSIFFSRIGMDTNQDGDISVRDNTLVYRIYLDDPSHHPYPATLARYAAYNPRTAGNRLFFLSGKGKTANCLALPLDGVISRAEDVGAQLHVAQSISAQIPYAADLALLGYYKIFERWSDVSAISALAVYEIGQLYADLNMFDVADEYFKLTIARYPNVTPFAGLAQIRKAVIDTKRALKGEGEEKKRTDIITQNVAKLEQIARGAVATVQARSYIERARLLSQTGALPASLLSALTLLDKVIETFASVKEAVAEAMIMKADIYSRIGSSAKVYPAYLSVIKHYEDVGKWADVAVEKILSITVPDISSVSQPETLAETIRKLRDLSENNRQTYPFLAMGALNRIGDLYFANDEWAKAKDAFRKVIETFTKKNRQTVSARLSLAEIYYREERFQKALQLYESEISMRSDEDTVFHLARIGYIRKSIASGQYLYRVSEVTSAQNVFKELMTFDDSIIEAHRGYIQCAASLGKIDEVLHTYLTRAAKTPNDAVAQYAAGLSLTYLNTKQDLLKAQEFLIRAVQLNGRIEYFHQTLGYVYEMLENVYKLPNMMEKSLEAYKKAYFLNEPQSNPVNAANLELNLGNAYFKLEQFNKAFEYYVKRLSTDIPFDNNATEIQFYRSLGSSAFQIDEPDKTIHAYQTAKALIMARMAPQAASDTFDRIHRFVMDNLIMPAMRQDDLKGQAQNIAQLQAKVSRRLSRLSENNVSIPSNEWETYKNNIEKLLRRQKEVLPGALRLLNDVNNTNTSSQTVPVAQAEQKLDFLIRKVTEDIRFAERLVELKTEILDRLGLAYQMAEEYEKALDCFQQVFDMNQKLRRNKNLATNLRSKAYNLYMWAQRRSGEERTSALLTSAADFENVIELARKYGVGSKKKRKSNGAAMLGLSLDVALDDANATQAAYGFTADQEIRLANAFISRIYLELGDLVPAEKAIAKQLQDYPPGAQIQAQDKYGVSLLLHRAGLLAVAEGDMQKGYDYFRRSAELCIEQKNTVSAALNIANMAKTMVRVQDTEKQNRYKQLAVLDDWTTALLTSENPATAKPVAAIYHNTMGVHLNAAFSSAKADPVTAVNRMLALKRAVMHFKKGIDYFSVADDDWKTYKRRDTLGLICALHLNLARTATLLGDIEPARQNFEHALAIAKGGLFPQFRWRALAGLGRLEDALSALEEGTIFNAGCSPGEIVSIFSPLVKAKVVASEFEDAFILAERLSEIERYQRTAFMLNTVSSRVKSTYQELSKLYERVDLLTQELLQAEGETKQFISERLADEKELIRMKTGDHFEKMPHTLRMITDDGVRKKVIILLGLAIMAESTADDIVKSSDSKQIDTLTKHYDTLVVKYNTVREEAVLNRPQGTPSDMVTFLGPEPAEPIDIMEYMPENSELIRVFETYHGSTGNEQPHVIVFKLTMDDIMAVTAPTVAAGLEKVITPGAANYFACDDLSLFNAKPSAHYVLSGTHFFRSLMSRKPFKRVLLSIPALSEPIAGYEYPVPDELQPVDVGMAKKNIHTLLISGTLHQTVSIPTHNNEIPSTYMAIDPGEGQKRVRLEQLLARTPNLSLAMLPGAAMTDAYLLGHLFAIFGCPTIMLPNVPETSADFAQEFLKAYAETSSNQALIKVMDESSEKGGQSGKKWFQIGYRGMTPAEAVAFAAKNFIHFVKSGQHAYKQNEPDAALTYFEEAILVAIEVPAYQKHLPGLYRYSRESAYRSHNLVKAADYAKRLVDWMAKHKPDTEEHAEALLTSGLIFSKLEKYDQAIPFLEEALEILENLESVEKHAQAMADLGIVLESATEYDRALTLFKSAATLSEQLNKKALLAEQFVNTARIYDMRLSQYAMAIRNYIKAQNMYESIGRNELVAQSLLDIGRCYRLLGNFAAAENSFKEAGELIKNEDQSQGTYLLLKTKIVMEQANNAWFQARYQDAFMMQRNVYQTARENKFELMQVAALNTSGLIWWTLGNQDKALLELENALDYAKKLPKRLDEVATTLNNIGLVYREMGRYQEALAIFDQALEIDTKIKSQWAIAYDYRNKALTLLKMGNAVDAIPLFKSAAQKAEAIGNRINEAKALLGWADALFETGDYEAAYTRYQKAFQLSDEMIIRETKWRAIYGLARLKLAENTTKSRDDAEKLLYDAMKIIENMRSEIKIDQLKDSFIVNKLSVYEDLAALLADRNKIVESFEVAERSRARNFIDLLGNQRLSLASIADQKLYDRQRTVRARIEEYETLYAQSTDAPQQKKYRAVLDNLNNEFHTIMLDIQAQNPQLGSLVSVDPIRMGEIASQLEPDVALLSYYLLKNELFCWVIRRPDETNPEMAQLIRMPVGRESLGRMILDFRRMIQNLDPLEDLSQELYRMLLPPAVQAHLTGIKTLGIIPHGPLHYLSFATLSDQDNYLIDMFSLFYLPSTSIINYTWNKRKDVKNVKVLAIGNPDLGDPTLDLPFAEQEVDAIQWNFPDIDVLTKSRATEAWVTSHIEQYGIIHLASHGEFNPVNPLFSAIKLAGSTGTKESTQMDGNLEVSEVFGLKINADLVVLSACQTGLGKVTGGDDVIGLNRAFFYAGTHAIVSSLWRVSDISTAILTKQFYRFYALNNKSDSLRRAMLHVKNHYPHPGYWGAFSLVGDYY